MKRLYSILTALTVVSLIACGKNAPNKNGAFTPGAANGLSPSGTVDGGGGNSYQGKMLETYIVNPKDLKGYKSISSLMTSLEKDLIAEDPDDNNSSYTYYSPITYILTQKPWYLIPSDISTLTNERIGVPFLNGTKQVALQTYDSIWIDQNAFEKMTEEERAKLILHEVFMGLKILKNDSTQKYLKAFYVNNLGLETAFVDLSEIEVESRGELNISSQDVDQVRTITAKIWSLRSAIQSGQFTVGDYAKLMVDLNFDKKIKFKDHSEAFGLYDLNSGANVSIDTVISDVHNYATRLYANHLYNSTTKKEESQSICQVDMKKINDKEVAVTFLVKTQSPTQGSGNNFELNVKRAFVMSVPHNLRYQLYGRSWYQDKRFPKIYLVGKGPTPETARTVELLFSGSRLEQARFVTKVIKPFDLDGSRVGVGQEVETFEKSILCVASSSTEFKDLKK